MNQANQKYPDDKEQLKKDIIIQEEKNEKQKTKLEGKAQMVKGHLNLYRKVLIKTFLSSK